MPKPKPRWGFSTTALQNLDIEPCPEEITALIINLSNFLELDLENIDNKGIKHESSPIVTFADFLKKLITDYRDRVLYDRYYPTNGSVKETLLYLKNIASELETRFEPLALSDGIDEETWYILEENLPEEHEGLGKFYQEGIFLRKAIDKALLELSQKDQQTGRRSELDEKVWLTTNIAITFQQLLKIKPSKTKGGKFDAVVSKILKACSFKQDNYVVNGYEAEQNFRVIKMALDEIKQKGHKIDPWRTRESNPTRLILPSPLDGPCPELKRCYHVTKGRIFIGGKEVIK